MDVYWDWRWAPNDFASVHLHIASTTFSTGSFCIKDLASAPGFIRAECLAMTMTRFFT